MEYADMLMESDGFSSWGFKKNIKYDEIRQQ